MATVQNPIQNQETEVHESLEPKSPFRRIEFHLARKPFTGFTKDKGDGTFRIETLNPDQNQAQVQTSGSGQNGGGLSGKKREAAEMENGFDPDLCFGISVVKRIGAGLENLGNTCFLNSVLQCLTYTEPLAAYLQSGKHQVTCRKSGFCALCAIQKHVSRALQSSGRSLAPKDLVSNLRCISRTFRNSRQEDAHEYMVNLLESMHKCCLPNGVPSESETAYDRSLVHKIFGGRLRSQVKCMQCNHCSNKYDPFLDLSLEILRADNLYKAFANFTAKEQLDGGAKQYQCQQCKQKVKALKQLTIHKAPNVLTVHLKRFGSHMSGQKIDKKIQFGSTLDLKPFVTGPYEGDLKYTLYGVLVHAGWSTHSGHYYCFVRTSSGMWYQLDDNRVYQVSEKKVFEQKAYMLFYFKDKKNIPVKKTTEAAHQKEKIVMNGTPNGSSTPAETQTKTNGSVNGQKSLTTVAQKETQMKTIFGSGLSNGHKSSATNGTANGPVAQKEAQMKTGSTNESSNGQKSFSPVESKEAQMNTTSSNGLPNGHNSLATVGTLSNGLTNGSLEQTEKKEGFVPKSISETILESSSNSKNEDISPQTANLEDAASKTEKNVKEIGGGESFVGNSSSDGQKVVAAATTDIVGLLKVDGSSVMKALRGKPHKKVKNHLKCKAISMKVSSKILMGIQTKKKKHKRNKTVKNLGQENSVNEGPSSSAKIEAQEEVKNLVNGGPSSSVKSEAQEVVKNLVNEGASSSVKNEAQEGKPSVENRFKERVNENGAVLATTDSGGVPNGSQVEPKGPNHYDGRRGASTQKDLVHMLTRGNDRVARWDDKDSTPSQISETTRPLLLGHVGDEWDEEYDRGKRKKVRMSQNEFDGQNPFQDIANERLKLQAGKQNLSKRPIGGYQTNVPVKALTFSRILG
nr:ubiquitin carboxyl-terminal hydrolase 23 [Tanacetum cinerariifolium]